MTTVRRGSRGITILWPFQISRCSSIPGSDSYGRIVSSDWHPAPLAARRFARGVEHALLGEAVLERRRGGERAAVAVVERRLERASEVERAAAEGTAGGVAAALAELRAGGAPERLALQRHEQLLAHEAHRAVLAVHRQRRRLVGAGGDGAERHHGHGESRRRP